MIRTGVQPAVKTPVQAAESTSRLFFIDHLRAALVVLVVLHHLALVYSGIPPFYYFEPPYNDPLAGLAGLVFVLFNQAWFMGAFFLLAGYFTPGSFDRKGPGRFLRGRLVRLGIPLLLFYFILSPIASIGYFLMPYSLTGITAPLTWQAYPLLLGLGPLWFVAMLLVFDFGYAAWRGLTANRTSDSPRASSVPGYFWIGLFVLALAAANYLIRIYIPLGRSVSQFPTLAYLPQYLSFFVLGAVASRQDWFRSLPGFMGVVGFVSAMLAAILLFPLALSGELLSLTFSEASLANAFGNAHWQSAVYALWDSVFAVGLCLAVIPLFRRFFNGRSRFGSFLSQHSYTVYIIHVPIIVMLAYALRGIELGAFLKYGLAAAVIVPICFAVAYLVRKIPRASMVL